MDRWLSGLGRRRTAGPLKRSGGSSARHSVPRPAVPTYQGMSPTTAGDRATNTATIGRGSGSSGIGPPPLADRACRACSAESSGNGSFVIRRHGALTAWHAPTKRPYRTPEMNAAVPERWSIRPWDSPHSGARKAMWTSNPHHHPGPDIEDRGSGNDSRKDDSEPVDRAALSVESSEPDIAAQPATQQRHLPPALSSLST